MVAIPGRIPGSEQWDMVEWTDWSASSKVSGYSGTPTERVWYRKMGKLVFVSFSFSGTSNSTLLSFTLPVWPADANGNQYVTLASGTDNGAPLAEANLVAVKNLDGLCHISKSRTSSGWTASGMKDSQGQFWYEGV